MEVVLAIFRPGAERMSFAVANDVTVIGRQEDCDLRIGILDVSRRHCRIIKDDNQLEVEDLGSSNGTYLNGLRVTEAMVKAGDVIQVGPVKFVVQIDGDPPDDQLSPERADDLSIVDEAEKESDGEEDDEEDDLVDLNLDSPSDDTAGQA
jgi:pSer/pThr/pTyr-binding forkhead associated (FHA) protein